MALLDPVVDLLVPGQSGTTPASTNPAGAGLSNAALSSFGSSANKGDSVTLSDTARGSSAVNKSVASTNSASAAAQQAAKTGVPAAQQASDAGADYSQAIRSLAALNKMTQAYNKALESAANARTSASASVDGRANGSNEASQLRGKNMSTSTGTESTDSTQTATDLSRSGTLASILMSSQIENNSAASQNVGSDRRNAVKSVAKV